MKRGQLKRGDRVRLVRECTDQAWGGQWVPAGQTGTLGRMYRVQNGLEMWPVFLHEAQPGTMKRLVGVTHLDVELLTV